VIFLIYGVQAYEALLGFGFGGTLLALSCAWAAHLHESADVGADLVGRSRRTFRGRPAQRRDDRR